MFLRLMNNGGKIVNAECVATAPIKRGTLVDGAGKVAVATADFAGIVVRGEVVDERVAKGLRADQFSVGQDTVAVGEYFGVEPIYATEMYATTEFNATSISSDALAKGKLKVVNGKLEADVAGTLQGLGFRNLPNSDVKFVAFRK